MFSLQYLQFRYEDATKISVLGKNYVAEKQMRPAYASLFMISFCLSKRVTGFVRSSLTVAESLSLKTSPDCAKDLKRSDETGLWIEDTTKTRIDMPVRKFGYRTVPFEWNELTYIVKVDQNLARLSRSVEQERDYQVYIRDLKHQWKSVYDHILCSKFELEQRKGDDGKYYAYPPISELEGSRKCIVQNDFPYYLAGNIEHWILWKIGGFCTTEDIDDARNQIQQQLGNVENFLHWINPPHLKSLPDIDHVHFLCLREDDPTKAAE
jgi:hypothetical protein